MKIKYTIFILFLAIAWGIQAQTDVRFGNEKSDTTVINELLDSRAASQNFANPEARVACVQLRSEMRISNYLLRNFGAFPRKKQSL